MIDQKELQEKMKERDKVSPSPEVRAAAIWAIIHSLDVKPTAWDLICFCCEAFAALASSGGYEFLQPFAKRLVSIVYTAHYNSPEPMPTSVESSQEVQSNFEIIRNDSFLG